MSNLNTIVSFSLFLATLPLAAFAAPPENGERHRIHQRVASEDISIIRSVKHVAVRAPLVAFAFSSTDIPIIRKKHRTASRRPVFEFRVGSEDVGFKHRHGHKPWKRHEYALGPKLHRKFASEDMFIEDEKMRGFRGSEDWYDDDEHDWIEDEDDWFDELEEALAFEDFEDEYEHDFCELEEYDDEDFMVYGPFEGYSFDFLDD